MNRTIVRSFVAASMALIAFMVIVESVGLADATPAVPPDDPCGDSDLLATTDRPTFGTNPCTVKPGAAFVEFGYRNTVTSGPLGGTASSVPQNRDRAGIVPRVEFVLDTPSAVTATSAGSRASGSSDLGTGLKYEIGYFHGLVHGIAAEVVYPTAGTPFSNGKPSFDESYQIGGGIVKNVGFNLTLGVDTFSSPNPGGGREVTTSAFQPTFVLGGAIAPRTKLNVELANSSSSGPGTSGRYDGNVFVQHAFTDYLLLDVEAAERFTIVNGTREHYVGFGGSIRF